MIKLGSHSDSHPFFGYSGISNGYLTDLVLNLLAASVGLSTANNRNDL